VEHIREIENWTEDQIRQEIKAGGRFVVYQLRVAGAISKTPEYSRAYFVRAGEKTRLRNFGYAFLLYRGGGSFFNSGEWMHTIGQNFRGGFDVTEETAEKLFGQHVSDRISDRLDYVNENRGAAIGRVRCRKCGIEYSDEAEKCWKCGTAIDFP
jgi:hypothetical protein